ncbi:hypothetical protein NHQ30_001836 [Ciborinia camelliae]|nr:hypothetical protein NHQ30_001836 [Ciborinia camelliae]
MHSPSLDKNVPSPKTSLPALEQSQQNESTHEALSESSSSLIPSRATHPPSSDIPLPHTEDVPPSTNELKEPDNLHEFDQSHLIYKCASQRYCPGKPGQCISYSKKPSSVKRPAEDSPDYLPHRSTKRRKYPLDFVHPCAEYTRLFQTIIQTQIDRLEHHNAGAFLVPERQTPEFYNDITRTLEDKSHGTVATYMACCKHNHSLWTRMGVESMPSNYYGVRCRACNHSYTSPDGEICMHCTTLQVLQRCDYEKEHGTPLRNYMWYHGHQELPKDLDLHHFWHEDEDGVHREYVHETSGGNQLGMYCSADPICGIDVN